MRFFRKIGLFDSGLGGLTVLRELRRQLPEADYVYLGDTARVPYGSKGAATVRRYAAECADFLVGQGVDQVVVACNTASSLALDLLQDTLRCPVTGTIDATAGAALAASGGKAIGVIGTAATVRSGSFEHALRAREPGVRIEARACPLFVPLVEEGLFEGALVESVIAHYLEDFRALDLGALILGCTHYPLLKDALHEYFGPSVAMISSSESVAAALACEGQGAGSGELSVYVTDEAGGFARFAAAVLDDVDKVHCERVELREIHV